MFSGERIQFGSLVVGLSLFVGGCSKPAFNPDKELATTSSVGMPNWDVSVRLYEVDDGKWALGVAGVNSVAVHEASAPMPDGKVQFGEMVSVPGYKVSVNMVKMHNDRWYVVVAGGTGVGVTEALGEYSAEKKVTFSKSKSVGDWRALSVTVTMQDGYSYLILAGGQGVDIAPLSREK